MMLLGTPNRVRQDPTRHQTQWVPPVPPQGRCSSISRSSGLLVPWVGVMLWSDIWVWGCSQMRRGSARLLDAPGPLPVLHPCAATGSIWSSVPPGFNLVGSCNIFPRLTLRKAWMKKSCRKQMLLFLLSPAHRKEKKKPLLMGKG